MKSQPGQLRKRRSGWLCFQAALAHRSPTVAFMPAKPRIDPEP